MTSSPSNKSVIICGFPGSGKTTYLAAFWSLVTEREVDTCLQFESLIETEEAYLNQIARTWRSGVVQERTKRDAGKIVSMSLRERSSSTVVRLAFADLSGESFQRAWEDRTIDEEVARAVRGNALVLAINADTVSHPLWVSDLASDSNELGLAPPAGAVSWSANLAPTQVQVVGLLQLLAAPPLGADGQRVAIVLSAWDAVEDEGLSPTEFIARKMPLLQQYLEASSDGWNHRAFGVSAQGAEYRRGKDDSCDPELDRLLENPPSERIKVVGSSGSPHDLTEPIAWALM